MLLMLLFKCRVGWGGAGAAKAFSVKTEVILEGLGEDVGVS